MLKKIVFTTISVLFCLMALAQPNVHHPIPPSPQSAAYAKYAQIPISKHTGTAKFEIPLRTLKGRKLETPVNLSYHASGTKLGEHSSSAGHGWVLHAGGVISRTVQGLPDDLQDGYMQASEAALATLCDANVTAAGTYDPQTKAWTENGLAQDLGLVDQLSDLAAGYLDRLPDIYTIYLDSLQAEFALVYKEQQWRAILSPYADLRLLPEIDQESGEIIGFELTKSDGTIYQFRERERRQIEGLFVDGTLEDSPYTDLSYNSAWYLSRILVLGQDDPESPAPPQIFDNVEFEYLSKSQRQDLIIDQVAKFAVGGSSECVESFWSDPEGAQLSQIQQVYELRSSVSTPYLQRMSTYSSPIEVNCQYANFGSTTAAIILESIEWRNGESVFQSFDLDYDHYGQYPHSNRQFLVEVDFPDYLTIDQVAWTMSYANPAQLADRDSNAFDHWGFYNGADNQATALSLNLEEIDSKYPDAELPDLSPSAVGLLADRSPATNLSTLMAGCLTAIRNPLGGCQEIEYEANRYLDEEEQIQEGGGLRVKSITDYADCQPDFSLFKEQSQRRSFEYEKGLLIYEPRGHLLLQFSEQDCQALQVHSNAAISSHYANGYAVSYTEVAEVFEGGGRIVEQFRNEAADEYSSVYPFIIGQNKKHLRGQLLQQTIIDESGSLKQVKSYIDNWVLGSVANGILSGQTFVSTDQPVFHNSLWRIESWYKQGSTIKTTHFGDEDSVQSTTETLSYRDSYPHLLTEIDFRLDSDTSRFQKISYRYTCDEPELYPVLCLNEHKLDWPLLETHNGIVSRGKQWSYNDSLSVCTNVYDLATGQNTHNLSHNAFGNLTSFRITGGLDQHLVYENVYDDHERNLKVFIKNWGTARSAEWFRYKHQDVDLLTTHLYGNMNFSESMVSNELGGWIVKSQTYDGEGRLESLKNGFGGMEVSYTINDNENEVIYESENQVTVSLKYDGLGRLKLRAEQYLNEPFSRYEGMAYSSDGKAIRAFAPYLSEDSGDVETALAAYYDTATHVTGPKAQLYTETRYERSPLSRLEKIRSLGDAQTSIFRYGFNHATEVLDLQADPTGDTYFAPGTLSKIIRIQDYEVNLEQFYNLAGQLLLQRENKDFDTYLLYDEFGNVQTIYPPQSIVALADDDLEIVASLCYHFSYRDDQRLASQKRPGAATVFYDYNFEERWQSRQESSKTVKTYFDGFARPVSQYLFTENNTDSLLLKEVIYDSGWTCRQWLLEELGMPGVTTLDNHFGSVACTKCRLLSDDGEGNEYVYYFNRSFSEAGSPRSWLYTSNTGLLQFWDGLYTSIGDNFRQDLALLNPDWSPADLLVRFQSGEHMPHLSSYEATARISYDPAHPIGDVRRLYNAEGKLSDSFIRTNKSLDDYPIDTLQHIKYRYNLKGQLTDINYIEDDERVYEHEALEHPPETLTPLQNWQDCASVPITEVELLEGFEANETELVQRFRLLTKQENTIDLEGEGEQTLAHLWQGTERLLSQGNNSHKDAANSQKYFVLYEDILAQGTLQNFQNLHDKLYKQIQENCEQADQKSVFDPPLRASSPQFPKGFAIQSDPSTKLFSQHIEYDSKGRVVEEHWRQALDGIQRSFVFDHDEQGSLVSATYGHLGEGFQEAPGLRLAGEYSLANLAYDPNGGLLSLQRWGLDRPYRNILAKPGFGQIDDLQYHYDASYPNQLIALDDHIEGPFPEPIPPVYTEDQSFIGQVNKRRGDFEDWQMELPTEYLYDESGNLTYDKHNDLYINYNHLKLPYQIIKHPKTKQESSVQLTYDASGRLWRKTVKPAPSYKWLADKENVASPIESQDSTHQYYWDYLGWADYYNGELAYINHPNGRLKAKTNITDTDTLKYFEEEFFIRDQEGRVRVVFSQDQSAPMQPSEPSTLNILEVKNYDPFNIELPGISINLHDMIGTEHIQYASQQSKPHDSEVKPDDHYDPRVRLAWSRVASPPEIIDIFDIPNYSAIGRRDYFNLTEHFPGGPDPRDNYDFGTIEEFFGLDFLEPNIFARGSHYPLSVPIQAASSRFVYPVHRSARSSQPPVPAHSVACPLPVFPLPSGLCIQSIRSWGE